MSLQLSEKFSLPKEAVLWTFAFLAIKGAGKTYDAAKLAEQMIKAGIPIVVLDPMGIWWGLRVGIGSGEGLPVVIFGGDHADLPIPTTLSKDKRHQIIDEDKLRQAVMAMLQAHLSVVFDTSQLSITQQTRAVSIFCDTLYHKNAPYGIRHVFIEEADEYCPQEPKGEKQASKEAIDQLVRRGGNPNIGVTMITQRSAVLNKNVLSQTGCLFVLRTIWMKDKDVIRNWVKSAVKDEKEVKKLAKWYDTLNELKNGEAWVYSPEHNIFEKIMFGERETLHATREYFLQETWEQKNITLRDVTLFVKAYKARIEPKPMVQPAKPVVVRQISSSDHDASTNRERVSDYTIITNPRSQPTVNNTKTDGFLGQTEGSNPSWSHFPSIDSSSPSNLPITSNAPSAVSVSQTKIVKQQLEKPSNIYVTRPSDSKMMASSEPSIAERILMSKESRSDFDRAAETSSENRPETPALGPMDLQLPARQTENAQVRLPDRGPLQSTSGTQFRSALGQALADLAPLIKPDTIVQQSLPTIEIHQTRPILRLPVEALNEPTTALGRVIVVLKNNDVAGGRPDKWTQKRIKEFLIRHSWPVEEVEEAIDQLIRWEILKVYPNGLMRFDAKRVQMVEVSPVLGVA